MLLRNTAANLINLPISIALSLMTTALLIKTLGATGFGLLTLIRSVIGNIGLIETMFGAGVTRFVADHESRGETLQRDRIVSTGFFVNLIQGLILASVMCVLAVAFSGYLFGTAAEELRREGVVVVGLFLGVFVVQAGVTAFSRALEGLQAYPAVRATETAAQIVLVAFLATSMLGMRGISLRSVAVLYLGIEVAQLVVLFVLLKLRGISTPISLLVDRESCSKLLRYGMPLFVAKTFTMLGHRGNVILIGAFLSLRAIAEYQVAQQVWLGALAGMSAVTGALLPVVSERVGRSGVDLSHLFLRASRYSLAAAFSIATLIVVFRDTFLRVWVGSEYVAAGGLIVLFMIQLVAAYHQGVSMIVAMGTGTHQHMARIEAVGNVLNLLLSLLLIQSWGAAGVIVAAIIKSAVAVPFYVAVALKTMNLSWGAFLRQSIAPVWRFVALTVAGSVLVSQLVDAIQGTDVALAARVVAIPLVMAIAAWIGLLEADDRRRLVRTMTANAAG